MKRFLCSFIALLIGATNVAKSQGEYGKFISEVLNEYKKHERRYIRKSDRIVKTSMQYGLLPKIPIDSIEYVIVPILKLHRDTKHCDKLDVESLVSYVNPKSMRYSDALVLEDGGFIGYINPPSYSIPYYVHNGAGLGDLEVYLSDYCKTHKPDLVFTIAAWMNLQSTPVFVIKDDNISVLCRVWISIRYKDSYIKEFSLEEFIENNEEIMGFGAFMYLLTRPVDGII